MEGSPTGLAGTFVTNLLGVVAGSNWNLPGNVKPTIFVVVGVVFVAVVFVIVFSRLLGGRLLYFLIAAWAPPPADPLLVLRRLRHVARPGNIARLV